MAVIKVGNNSIGKISVIEPYDDSIDIRKINQHLGCDLAIGLICPL